MATTDTTGRQEKNVARLFSGRENHTGPHLICDKSTLQALSRAELNAWRWYYSLNIPPVLITCCIVPIQKAHAIDHKFLVHYIRRIEGMAAAEDRPHPRKIRMYRPWLVGQSLFSLLLTIIAIVMIIAGGKGKAHKQEEEKPVPAASAQEKGDNGTK
jgi:hypothetical protein